jgi:hypothetical protein
MWWPTPSAEVLSWPNSSSWFNRFEDTQPMMMIDDDVSVSVFCSVLLLSLKFEF